ncbi:MAG: flagellar export protein FliJ [Hyphomicrobiales bacterium]|nr:flagellar export protein FliJ [Hyphomicrobiales bacterium]MBV9050906.1 flagellar export protein FliJ [Hyphomicrobiales bacterium]MBV9135746.1 flagellar export protein FliJ [Hyphomicrobiales bacterium]MBV9973835.1 flagellar export protein FliJ [Hyphomicrobiales bacterium]
MKTRGSLIRLKRFAADEKSRNLTRIETMIREFSKDSAELDREIAAEEARAGITDPKHFAYPTYAKAATQRRDNLRRSVEDLKLQLEEARAEYEDALADLKKMEALDERERTLEAPRGETSSGFAMARA